MTQTLDDKNDDEDDNDDDDDNDNDDDNDDDDDDKEEEEDVENQRRLYLYRHHFIDSMLGCSRRHNAVTGHFSFEQEATTFVPYFCCPPHYVFLYSTLYILYMS